VNRKIMQERLRIAEPFPFLACKFAVRQNQEKVIPA